MEASALAGPARAEASQSNKPPPALEIGRPTENVRHADAVTSIDGELRHSEYERARDRMLSLKPYEQLLKQRVVILRKEHFELLLPLGERQA